jgi:cell division septation protein DedD
VAETHEPSYYEIALTNRQVIVAFVILLICLLSAFFSGVWIGRESTARAEEQAMRNAPPPQVAQEGKNLEELDFFNSRDQAGDEKEKRDRREATPAPQPSSSTTLLQDFGGSEPAPQKTVPPAGEKPAETPHQTSAAAAAPAAGETGVAPSAATRREPPAKPNPPAAAPAAASKASQPAVPKGSVVIQVFSSADRSQADVVRQRLVKGGYPAFLSPVEVGGHAMYRVRIGPFASRSDAQKTAEKVRTEYKLDTWVTE